MKPFKLIAFIYHLKQMKITIPTNIYSQKKIFNRFYNDIRL